MPGQQIQARIDGDLKDKFNYFLDTHKKFNSSGLVRAALQNYLFTESEFEDVFKELVRLNKDIEEYHIEQQNHTELILESFYSFLKYYFSYTPTLPEAEKNEANKKSLESFKKYTSTLVRQLRPENSITTKILKLKEEEGGEYASR